MLSADESVHCALQWPALSPQARRHAAWLATARPDPADPDLPQARALRERYPDLRAATPRWDAPADDDTEQQQAREEQQRRRTFSETRLRHTLTALTTGEGPPGPLWQQITRELYRTADGTEASPDRWLGAVAAAPSFPSEASELHRLLLDAAVTVTRRSPVLAEAAASPATTDWNRTATTLTALALLNGPAVAARAMARLISSASVQPFRASASRRGRSGPASWVHRVIRVVLEFGVVGMMAVLYRQGEGGRGSAARVVVECPGQVRSRKPSACSAPGPMPPPAPTRSGPPS
ncbi:hypothetical protein [Streptomyces sp. bgisy034]|uniref:hypothetical protein n=1 Tax=Streptomyces sp. bgisy034 TaxID=3413774 RepID=UPI003EBBA325